MSEMCRTAPNSNNGVQPDMNAKNKPLLSPPISSRGRACMQGNYFLTRFESNQEVGSLFMSEAMNRCPTMYGTDSFGSLNRFSTT